MARPKRGLRRLLRLAELLLCFFWLAWMSPCTDINFDQNYYYYRLDFSEKIRRFRFRFGKFGISGKYGFTFCENMQWTAKLMLFLFRVLKCWNRLCSNLIRYLCKRIGLISWNICIVKMYHTLLQIRRVHNKLWFHSFLYGYIFYYWYCSRRTF